MLHANRTPPRETIPSRRGAVARGCLIAGGIGAALLGLVLLLGAVFWSKFNQLTAGRESVKMHWAEIDNQYKRRFDLIPNLVETVKGAADFEKSTLDAVTQARASVGKVQLPGNLPTDPAQLQAYMQAQQSLSGALSRLFAVAENYPQLRGTQNFLSLQDQIEGTENRVAVARRDYLEAVRLYNTSAQTFPGNVIAGLFHFETIPQLEIAPEERATPKVDFGTSGQKK
jgi:LemA protein